MNKPLYPEVKTLESGKVLTITTYIRVRKSNKWTLFPFSAKYHIRKEVNPSLMAEFINSFHMRVYLAVFLKIDRGVGEEDPEQVPESVRLRKVYK